ncbi:VOC family protein [Flavobacterium sp. WC2421]|uniref:VOC family protein n=1 Tax=Flavobacterium sp. WC2421 TaxID=3234138 RepID=UPI0034670B43
MSVQTTPHFNFRGEARTALEFYHSIFGGKISIATYADINAVEDPSQTNLVAFGDVKAPNGFHIMGYDVQPSKAFDKGINPFYVTLHSTEPEEIKKGWEALAKNAKAILIPFGPAPFAPLYGMLTDQFGVTWIVGLVPED